MPQKGLYWVFTVNNYTDVELDILRALVDAVDHVTFLCFGLELAPSSGTPHAQGYLQLSTRKSTGQVCTLLGGRARVELAKGSCEQNQKYCSKTRDEDTEPNAIYEEYGQAREPRGKKRSRESDDIFDQIKEDIESGASLVEICRRYPKEFIKFHAGIQKMFSTLKVKYQDIRHGPWRWNLKPQLDFSKSFVIYGPTNIGKTQYVISLFPKLLLVTHLDGLKAYASGAYDAILFDDMSFRHLPDRTQLFLCDQDVDRDIHVRYGTVTIPRNTPKFFLHNRRDEVFDFSLPEIRRRVDIIKFTEDNFYFE